MEIRRSYGRLVSTMRFPIRTRGYLYIESGPRILIKSIENGYAWNRLHRLSGSKTVLHLDSEKVTCEKSTTLHIPENCHVRLSVCSNISHHLNRALRNQLNPITKVMDIFVQLDAKSSPGNRHSSLGISYATGVSEWLRLTKF